MTRGAPAPDHDVVVVGARCAGAATAMLLARAGVSVLLVDRARHGSDTLSTHALTLPGVLQLSRWGLLDRVRAAGTPTVRAVVQDYGDRRVEIPIRPRGDVDGLYAPRRFELDSIVADAAREAGAEVWHGVGVEDLIRDGKRVRGVVLGDGTRIRSRFVVGADGARSSVARLVDAEILRLAAHSSASVYTYDASPARDAYVNVFRPGFAAGSIPTSGGECNVWASVRMGQMPRDRTQQAGLLERAASSLGIDVLGSGPLRTFLGRRGFVRRAWGAGWALVGDAAYFKDPLSAHGMTDALIGAELLASALVDAAGGLDEGAALRRYSHLRRGLTAPMMPAVEHMASFDWDPTSLQRAHGEANLAMRAEWAFLAGLPSRFSG